VPDLGLLVIAKEDLYRKPAITTAITTDIEPFWHAINLLYLIDVRLMQSIVKFFSMRSLMTDLGMTLQSFGGPHTKRICGTVFPFFSAISDSVLFLYKGDPVDPRQG
jgi:hypothetical protein